MYALLIEVPKIVVQQLFEGSNSAHNKTSSS